LKRRLDSGLLSRCAVAGSVVMRCLRYVASVIFAALAACAKAMLVDGLTLVLSETSGIVGIDVEDD
jgi:hypothetical protein